MKIYLIYFVIYFVIADGAPPPTRQRLPTERWFLPRRTFTKLYKYTNTIIESEPASCMHYEPMGGCNDDLSRVQRFIKPSNVVHKPMISSTINEDDIGYEKIISSSLDSSWELYSDEHQPEIHKATRLLTNNRDDRLNWALFNLDSTITQIIKIMKTERVIDPEIMITVLNTDCNKNYNDIPLCEDDTLFQKQNNENRKISVTSEEDQEKTTAIPVTNEEETTPLTEQATNNPMYEENLTTIGNIEEEEITTTTIENETTTMENNDTTMENETTTMENDTIDSAIINLKRILQGSIENENEKRQTEILEAGN